MAVVLLIVTSTRAYLLLPSQAIVACFLFFTMPPRFQQPHDRSDVPIPTTRHPPISGATIRRAKTLTRPERGVAPVPLINPPTASPSGSIPIPIQDQYNGSTPWRYFSLLVTFWAPNVLLSSIGGLKDKATRQAWREKMALCFIILLLCAAVGFATVGFQKVLCPASNSSDSRFLHVGSVSNTLGVQGVIFNVSSAKSTDNVNFSSLAQVPGQDITAMFQRDAAQFSHCAGLNFHVATDPPCSTPTPCLLPPINSSSTYKSLSITNTGFLAGYAWSQVALLDGYFVLDGAVLNMKPYLTLHPQPVPSDNVDRALRTLMQPSAASSGKDGTRLFYSRSDLVAAVPCLKQRYYVGNIDKITPGCFISDLFLYAGLIVILGLVFVRFIMACVFNWFLSEKLAGPPNSQQLNRSAISPAVLPGGANISVDNRNGTAPWAGPSGTKKTKLAKSARSIASSSSATLINSDNISPVVSLTQIGAELFAVCLVTCYSEGEESLRTTLDSISTTKYSDARKLLFVVADGMITGAGEKKSTPDICVGLLEADPRFGNPIPMTYGAVGSGAKAQNRAMVYAGHYSRSFLP
jgi:chitin synthase